MTGERPLGDCFQKAGLCMVEHYLPKGVGPGFVPNPTLVLCHGIVRDSFGDGWIDHAWCEVGGVGIDEQEREVPLTVVIDDTQAEGSRILPAEFFYQHTQAHHVRRFTFAEMVANALKHGHDGPWPTGDRNEDEATAEGAAQQR